MEVPLRIQVVDHDEIGSQAGEGRQRRRRPEDHLYGVVEAPGRSGRRGPASSRPCGRREAHPAFRTFDDTLTAEPGECV